MDLRAAFAAILDRPSARYAQGNALADALARGAPELAPLTAKYDEACAAALLALLSSGCPPRRQLHHLATVQVRLRHGIRDGGEIISDQLLTDLSADALLLLLLSETINSDLVLERLLTRIRAHMLGIVATGQALGPLRRLAVALALQCCANEFVFASTPGEEAAAGTLVDALEASLRGRPSDDTDLTVACAMYRSLASLPHADLLATRCRWNEDLPLGTLLVQRSIDEPRQERILRDTLEGFGSVASDSSRVREQYEESPTPRWRRLVVPRRSIADHIHRLGGGAHRPERRLEILVPGCGTGRHPIRLALANPDAHVLALDFSRASLAYAVRMKQFLKVENVSFLHGDLFDLPTLGRTFDHVDCVGVLQTLEQPETAWPLLSGLLRPAGTLRVNVYGTLSRLPVAALRARLQAERLTPTAETVREVRQRLIRQPEFAHLLARLSRSLDFYTTSESRDLLFHVREHQFTVAEIEASVARTHLRLINVHLPAAVKARARQISPECRVPVMSFDDWHRIEKAFTATLAPFDFWLQAPDRAQTMSADRVR